MNNRLARLAKRKAPRELEPASVIDITREVHSARRHLFDVLKVKAPAGWLKDLLGHPALREPEPPREPISTKADEPNPAAGAREQLLHELDRHRAALKEPEPPPPFVEPPMKAPMPEPSRRAPAVAQTGRWH